MRWSVIGNSYLSLYYEQALGEKKRKMPKADVVKTLQQQPKAKYESTILHFFTRLNFIVFLKVSGLNCNHWEEMGLFSHNSAFTLKPRDTCDFRWILCPYYCHHESLQNSFRGTNLKLDIEYENIFKKKQYFHLLYSKHVAEILCKLKYYCRN